MFLEGRSQSLLEITDLDREGGNIKERSGQNSRDLFRRSGENLVSMRGGEQKDQSNRGRVSITEAWDRALGY